MAERTAGGRNAIRQKPTAMKAQFRRRTPPPSPLQPFGFSQKLQSQNRRNVFAFRIFRKLAKRNVFKNQDFLAQPKK
jgi:hypothetical protein